jgi:ribosomal protein S18 acetylase RimI-like enzyme
MCAQETPVLQGLSGDFGRWEELLGLIRRSFSSMDGVIDPPSSAARLTPDALRRKADEEIGVVALLGGDLAGCVFLAERDDHFYVGKLAVEPALHGRGIGRLLMTHAEAIARVAGKPLLELQTRVELVANQALFARLGFSETARTAHAGYDRPTSVTMRKALV